MSLYTGGVCTKSFCGNVPTFEWKMGKSNSFIENEKLEACYVFL